MMTVLMTVVSLTACGGSDAGPMGPDLPNVAGGWVGSAQDTYDDDQTVSVFLEQDGSELSGTINSMIFRTARPFALSGTVEADGTVSVTVLAADTGGCFDITVALSLRTRGRRLSGSYVIDRKADGCGRMPIPPPMRPFSLDR